MNLQQARAFCLALPGATEDVKWGDNLVFSVGEKMFACMHADDRDRAISFKVEDERFLELTDRPGIAPAPYLARARWVQVQDLQALGDAEASELLARAHALIFARLSKKLQRDIEGAA